MVRSWNLSDKQKTFLEDEGLKSEDYKIVGTTANDFIFYNTKTRKLVPIRR